MSTNVTTGWLKDNNGEKFAPKTTSTQVIMGDGNNLENKIKNIGGNTEITIIEDGVESTLNGMRINKFDTKDEYEAALENGEIADNEFCSFPEDNSTILNLIYPVGSIYMSVNNVSPATFIGGTWEALKDRFLIGAGNSYSGGATGGEATHKLTINEMPSHTHQILYAGGTQKTWGYNYSNDGGTISSATFDNAGINNTGGSAAHNNMPPYLAVYMWKRTA